MPFIGFTNNLTRKYFHIKEKKKIKKVEVREEEDELK